MIQNKKKILVFSLVYLPDFVGGAEVAIDQITKNISEYDFDLVTLRMSKHLPKIERQNNLTIYRIGPSIDKIDKNKLTFILRLAKIFFPILAFLKAIKLRRQNKYSVVWSMMANQSGFAGMFYKTFFPKVKFLLTLQEGDSIYEILIKVRYVMFLFKRIFKKADHVQVISNYLRDWAIQMGVSGNKITLVPNGVDLNIFNSVNRNKVDEKGIVTASRLVPKNGISDLILAMKHLPEEYTLIVLGEGYLFSKLQELVLKNNLESRVYFMGYIKQDEMPKFFNRSGVFCRPSITEGFGNVFIEAMASGLPVVATGVGGIKDIITDYENGIFAEPKNPESIAQKILEITNNDILRQKIIKNGLVFAKNFDWKIISEQMKDIFANLN